MKRHKTILLSVMAVFLLLGSIATAQDPGAEMSEADKIGQAMANPLSYLWLTFMQNDLISYKGDMLDAFDLDDLKMNTFLFQPVLSVQLTEKWKTIIRPVIPINSFETVENLNISVGNRPEVVGIDLERKTGIGDIVLWTAFSNQYEPPFVWGFGPTLMLNTASHDFLGTGKTSAGPMALGVSITDKWIIGGVAQHWWSFTGDDQLTVNTDAGSVEVDRSDVSLTDFQPILRYRLSLTTNIGFAPNWRYNWESEELTLPIGLGFDFLTKFGPLPVKLGHEAYYYVATDEDMGPDWQVRLLMIPVLPAPGWARNPLF